MIEFMQYFLTVTAFIVVFIALVAGFIELYDRLKGTEDKVV